MLKVYIYWLQLMFLNMYRATVVVSVHSKSYIDYRQYSSYLVSKVSLKIDFECFLSYHLQQQLRMHDRKVQQVHVRNKFFFFFLFIII